MRLLSREKERENREKRRKSLKRIMVSSDERNWVENVNGEEIEMGGKLKEGKYWKCFAFLCGNSNSLR